MTNAQVQPQTPEQSREIAISTVGNDLANSVTPPAEMARQLNGAFFTIIKDSWQYEDMSEEETDALDATFFILIDCLLRLNQAKLSK